MNKLRLLFLGTGLAILQLAVTPALAQDRSSTCMTPTLSTMCSLQPSMWHLDDRPHARTVSGELGYSVTWIRVDGSLASDDFDPDLTFSSAYSTGLNGGWGAFLNHGHGSNPNDAGGYAIAYERYPHNELGHQHREDAYLAYVDNPMYQGIVCLFSDELADEAWYLGGLKSGMMINMADRAIVHNQTCYGEAMDNSNWDAAVAVGPSGTIGTSDSKANDEKFWQTMQGLRGQDRSAEKGADNAPNLVLSGDGNMTLVPGFWSSTHPQYTAIPTGGIWITIELDTFTSMNPPGSAAMTGTGVIQVDSAYWLTDTQLAGHVTTNGVGTGTVFISGSVASVTNASAYLNGGYGWSLHLRHPDDPAADVNGFGVFDNVAEWTAETEHNTLNYEVRGSDSKDGPWQTLGTVEATHADKYTFDVSAWQKAYFQLMENETTGRRIFHDMAKPDVRSTRVATQLPPRALLLEQLNTLKQERDNMDQPPLPIEGQRYVIYTVELLESVVQEYIADYWDSHWGYDVEVKTVDNLPTDNDQFRSALQADIVAEKSAGTMYFLLIGDSNDWEAWTTEWDGPWQPIQQSYWNQGYPVQGQPERDLIPTFIVWDPEPRGINMSWFTPYYFTDKPYWDTDGDGARDVVGSRLPFTTVNQVLAYAYKMQYATQFGDYGAHYAGFYTRDTDYDDPSDPGENNGDGALAAAIADTLKTMLPPGIGITEMLHSDYPVTSERNDRAAYLWQGYTYEVLVMVSPMSNRSRPADNFVQTDPSNPWTMDMIHPDGNHAPLVIAGSCDGADWARTEKPTWGMPICERFLEPSHGAIAWVAPTIGTWQTPNQIVMTYFWEEIWNDPERSLAESFMVADQRISVDYADAPDVLQVLESYQFLGSALTRLNHVQIPTPVDDGQAPTHHALEQCFPNPFNPSTQINFSVANATGVQLTIYDSTGRLVKILINKPMQSGHHSIEWHGKIDGGQRAASGVYFYRLVVNDQVMTKKMTLLK
jgi:hypothetical protein